MYFILNKTIIFYPDTNELAIINEQDNSIVLSKPASRLLLTLINHLNVVVTRDYLLKTVWEDYGYTPSNNNLYMAISELRKSFSSLNGGESILVTVPKVGLRLEALVDALEKGGNAEEKKETRTETEIEPLAEEKPGEEEEKKISSIYRLKSNTGVKVKISLALILSSLAIFLFNLEENVPIKNSVDDPVFNYGTCAIFSHTLSLGVASNNDSFQKSIINKLNEHNINCDNVKKNIYFQTTLKRSGDVRSYFIGVCSVMKNSEVKKCETINETLE